MNLEALEKASQDLAGGAFKLWVYFAKNQNNYQFALSSADAEKTMGIKIKQYNNAVKELIDKKYLVPIDDKSNIYDFYEVSRAVIPSEDNPVILKGNNALSPESIRNITPITIDNTKAENNEDYNIFMKNEW